MKYIKSNKNAWEEAFENKKGYYADDMAETLLHQKNPYLDKPLNDFLDQVDLSNKIVGQFCTNNGRELLSIATRGIQQGYGFDIAKNMVDYANQVAIKTNLPVTFIETNILEIDDTYNNTFDYLFITVGALCWFENLDVFFSIVGKVLKKGGKLVINEAHPVINLLATDDEPGFIIGHEKEMVYDYFKSEPWETESMGYMTENQKQSSKFYSFSHTLSSIINSISKHQMSINSFFEFDYCIANLLNHLDHQGIQLSYLLVASKDR